MFISSGAQVLNCTVRHCQHQAVTGFMLDALTVEDVLFEDNNEVALLVDVPGVPVTLRRLTFIGGTSTTTSSFSVTGASPVTAEDILVQDTTAFIVVADVDESVGTLNRLHFRGNRNFNARTHWNLHHQWRI